MASIAASLATASVIAWQFLPALEKPTTPVVLTQSAISSTQPRIDWSAGRTEARLPDGSVLSFPKRLDDLATPITYLGKDHYAKGQKLGTLSHHDGKSFFVETDANGISHEYELRSIDSATIAVRYVETLPTEDNELLDPTVDRNNGSFSGETMAKVSETFRNAILHDLRDQPGKPWKGTLNDLPQSIPEDLRKSLQAQILAKKSVTIHQNEQGGKVLHWLEKKERQKNPYGFLYAYHVKIIRIAADGKVETQSLQINN